MSNYARADKTTQWFQDNYPGADMKLTPETMVVCLHTTEGLSWPGYGGGATAPNYTGQPPIWRHKKAGWRAHFPDEKSSRALQNKAGGVETNTLNVVQVELIGTCDPKHAKSWNAMGKYLAGRDYVYWPNATWYQRRWLARLLADFNVRHGLKLYAPKTFLPYPKSYGDSPVRLSPAAWRQTVGVVGHQHVPENSHGDPGNIKIDDVLVRAKVRARNVKLFIRRNKS